MDYELKDIDTEDIEDLLLLVEDSFGIRFVDNELSHITTFGELCDHITAKICLEDADDCTHQQAFYKLRDAISIVLHIDKKSISTNTPLVDLLPKRNKRKVLSEIEEYLGFKLCILRQKTWIMTTLCILLLGSLAVLFFNWKIGIIGIVLSVVGLRFADKIGNNIEFETVGQVAKKMTNENYLKSRRNPDTYNKKEIEKVMIDLFSAYFNLNKSKLTQDVKLV